MKKKQVINKIINATNKLNEYNNYNLIITKNKRVYGVRNNNNIIYFTKDYKQLQAFVSGLYYNTRFM